MLAFCVYLCIHGCGLQAALFGSCLQAYSDLYSEVNPEARVHIAMLHVAVALTLMMHHSQLGLLRPGMHSLSTALSITACLQRHAVGALSYSKLSTAHIQTISVTLLSTLVTTVLWGSYCQRLTCWCCSLAAS